MDVGKLRPGPARTDGCEVSGENHLVDLPLPRCEGGVDREGAREVAGAVPRRLGAGADLAASGGSHNIPVIREFMQRSCVAYFDTVADFAELILR